MITVFFCRVCWLFEGEVVKEESFGNICCEGIIIVTRVLLNSIIQFSFTAQLAWLTLLRVMLCYVMVAGRAKIVLLLPPHTAVIISCQ